MSLLQILARASSWKRRATKTRTGFYVRPPQPGTGAVMGINSPPPPRAPCHGPGVQTSQPHFTGDDAEAQRDITKACPATAELDPNQVCPTPQTRFPPITRAPSEHTTKAVFSSFCPEARKGGHPQVELQAEISPAQITGQEACPAEQEPALWLPDTRGRCGSSGCRLLP